MKTLFTAAFAAAFLMAGQAWADDAASKDTKKPVELTAAQMDGVTAGFAIDPGGADHGPAPKQIASVDNGTTVLPSGHVLTNSAHENLALWRAHQRSGNTKLRFSVDDF